jgi:hypothetical protein
MTIRNKVVHFLLGKKMNIQAVLIIPGVGKSKASNYHSILSSVTHCSRTVGNQFLLPSTFNITEPRTGIMNFTTSILQRNYAK